MNKSIVVSEGLYAQLETLARPFVDKEPADVIRWLVNEVASKGEHQMMAPLAPPPHPFKPETAVVRVPRQRAVVVGMDGTAIHADTVPDLCAKVMDYLFAHGHGTKILGMSPYKTSTERYLFSKTPKHPNGNDFFSPISCHGLRVETHKSYQTAIKQLATFVAKCGVKLTYLG